MKKILSFIFLSALLTLGMSNVAMATFFGTGDNYVLEEAISDDAYISGGNARIEKDVNGDLYIFGGNVTINGNVAEDLVVAGGMVNIYGNVGDDLRVFAGNVVVYGSVGDDLITGAGKVDITKTSVIGGSLIPGSGILTLDGEVKGDIHGAAGMLILNGKVGGNVTMKIEERIDFGKEASIEGNLTYSSLLELTIPENVVKGKVEFNEFEDAGALNQVTWGYVVYKLISYVSALVLLLLMVLIAPKVLIESANLSRDNVLKSFGVGLLSLISLVVGSLLLLVTVVGIPLALIIWAMLLVVFYVTKVFIAAFLARLVMDMSKKRKHMKVKIFFAMALAMLVYYLVCLIPFVGWIFNMVLFLIGVGSLIRVKFSYFEYLKGKNML